METTVQRWCNSLALRIPNPFAEEISVREGDEVEMDVDRGRLVVAPRPPRDYHLADLEAQLRPGNLHQEIVVGHGGLCEQPIVSLAPGSAGVKAPECITPRIDLQFASVLGDSDSWLSNLLSI